MKAPNGWISHDLLIWNELDRRGYVSKGFVLDVPDLRHGSENALNSFYQAIRQFLHTLDESTRAQLRWSVDSNYREELLAYHASVEGTIGRNKAARSRHSTPSGIPGNAPQRARST